VSGLAAALTRRRAPALPALSPRLKRRLAALLMLSLLLAGGYRFWLRDSSLVSVEKVKVSGLTTSDAQRVRMALTTSARGMTTLHVDHERLERAVEAYPVVRELKVTPELPHGLRVHVVEHVPAALAVSDAGQLPVAGDGTILRGLPVEGELPTVTVDGVLGGDHLRDADARAAAAVAGAAPAVLRKRMEQVERRAGEGLVAELADGPELIFGAASQLPAKWAAAARVLADPEARGASYIDLRIPGRPAAGGLPAETVTPVAPAGTPPAQTTTPDGTTTTPDGTTTTPDGTVTTPDGTVTTPDGTAAVPNPGAAAPDPTATPPATTAPPTAGADPATPPVTPAPTPPAGGAEGGVAAPPAP
jgi:cell division protein FtsQ